MKRCNCCNKERKTVNTYVLPQIGYGSAFDSGVDGEPIRFSLCDDCAMKINRWVKKKLPDVKLADFWKCKIIEKYDDNGKFTHYEYEFEKTLEELFDEFLSSRSLDEMTSKMLKKVVKSVIKK